MPKQKSDVEPGVPVRVQSSIYPDGVPVAVPPAPNASETTSGSKSGQKAATKKGS